jgi:hypothetical protein
VEDPQDFHPAFFKAVKHQVIGKFNYREESNISRLVTWELANWAKLRMFRQSLAHAVSCSDNSISSISPRLGDVQPDGIERSSSAWGARTKLPTRFMGLDALA